MITEPFNGFRFPEANYRAPDQVQPRFAPLKLFSNEGDTILRWRAQNISITDAFEMGNCRIELVVRNVIIGGEYLLAGYVRSWGDSESEQLAKNKRFINTHRSMVWRIDKNWISRRVDSSRFKTWITGHSEPQEGLLLRYDRLFSSWEASMNLSRFVAMYNAAGVLW
jgi:hypothetical protein